MERMGDTGDPCGVPMLISKGSKSDLLNLRHTFWSSRKDLHHWMISGAKPRFCISCTSLAQFTLSKKPETSNRHMPVLSPAVCAFWMSCIRHSPVLMVKDTSCPLNWFVGIRSSCMISWYISHATAFLTNLPRHSRRVMGQKFLGRV